jgi:hypothetical protein
MSLLCLHTDLAKKQRKEATEGIMLARTTAETSATPGPIGRETLAGALRAQSAPGMTLQLTLNDGTTRIIHYPVLLSEDVVEFPSGAKLRDRIKISWSEIASIRTNRM